ncbi:unnamed protein product [Coregonus sp. 'balchen']|nr:unnamed protein product [Coregonus sp. 'balchen']
MDSNLRYWDINSFAVALVTDEDLVFFSSHVFNPSLPSIHPPSAHKLAQHLGTPVHEINGRLPGRPDGQGTTMTTTLLLSRHAQTPLQPVLWTLSAAPSTSSPRGLRPARTRAPGLQGDEDSFSQQVELHIGRQKHRIPNQFCPQMHGRPNTARAATPVRGYSLPDVPLSDPDNPPSLSSSLKKLSVDSDYIYSLPDDSEENGQYEPTQNVPESDHGGFATVPAGSEPSPHTSASNATHPGEASFNAVIAELSKGKRLLEKVFVESWLVERLQQHRGGGLKLKPRSGKSLFDQLLVLSGNGVSISSRCRRRVTEATSPAVNPRATTATGSDSLLKPRKGYFRQKRTLKKPERVPSIYKLKLRPRVHPRHDYRPGRKPMRIPTQSPTEGINPQRSLEGPEGTYT